MVEAGNYLEVGQALMAIVPDDVWVVANFKETQLDAHASRPAGDVKIDAYPDANITATWTASRRAAAAAFSLLPPENATGNFVKVVQRVPVKIVFDQKLPDELSIAPGMSVEPEVKVKD